MYTEWSHYVLLQTLFCLFCFKRKDIVWLISMSFLACSAGLCSTLVSYMYSDFSIYNTFTNSNANTPLFYKISATWSNHEGSFLLWCWLLTLYGFIFCYCAEQATLLWKRHREADHFSSLFRFKNLYSTTVSVRSQARSINHNNCQKEASSKTALSFVNPVTPLLSPLQRRRGQQPLGESLSAKADTVGTVGRRVIRTFHPFLRSNTPKRCSTSVTVMASNDGCLALFTRRGTTVSTKTSSLFGVNNTTSPLKCNMTPFMMEWGVLRIMQISKWKQLKQSTDPCLIYLCIMFFFVTFLVLTSNPFLRMPFLCLHSIVELNPVLQDPVLAIHPPCIYAGYVASAVGFSICLSKLIQPSMRSRNRSNLVQQPNSSFEKRDTFLWLTRDLFSTFNAQVQAQRLSVARFLCHETEQKNIALERQTRNWSLIAWCFLTVGILLGSWWAYHELGWGGWWFWDPVENASLMPWICATAAIHSVLIPRLAFVTLCLNIATFVLSLLGTFFVRSGLLASVHSFAEDSTRGLFLLAFLLCVSSISVFFLVKQYSQKASALQTKTQLPPVGIVEQIMLLQALFWGVICAVVLCGTSAPILFQWCFNRDVSTGAPFFNGTLIPLFASILVMLIYVHSRQLQLGNSTVHLAAQQSKAEKGAKTKNTTLFLWFNTLQQRRPTLLTFVVLLPISHLIAFQYFSDFSCLEACYSIASLFLFCCLMLPYKSKRFKAHQRLASKDKGAVPSSSATFSSISPHEAPPLEQPSIASAASRTSLRSSILFSSSAKGDHWLKERGVCRPYLSVASFPSALILCPPYDLWTFRAKAPSVGPLPKHEALHHIIQPLSSRFIPLTVYFTKVPFNGTLSHAGLGLFLLGIVLSNTHKIQLTQMVRSGSQIGLGSQIFCLRGIDQNYGPTFHSVCGNLVVYEQATKTLHQTRLISRVLINTLSQEGHFAPLNGPKECTQSFTSLKRVLSMFPEKRFFFFNPQLSTTKVAIHTNLFTDLYCLIGAGSAETGWYTTIMRLPFIGCIWIGFLVASIGGLRSLVQQQRKVKLKWT